MCNNCQFGKFPEGRVGNSLGPGDIRADVYSV
jgi:hypothetical protein